MNPTDEQICRIVGLLYNGYDQPVICAAWHREDGFKEGENRPCIIFGSGTWPEYRRGVYVDEIIPALERYDAKEIGSGI